MNESDPRSDVHYLGSSENKVVSLVGRALHRYRRGHGFKSRKGLNFFFFNLKGAFVLQ